MRTKGLKGGDAMRRAVASCVSSLTDVRGHNMEGPFCDSLRDEQNGPW